MVHQCKTCSQCSNVYPATIEFFCGCKAAKDGLNTRCKLCVANWQKIYRKAHKVEKVVYSKNYRELHKREIAEYGKAYWKTHKKRLTVQRKECKKTIEGHLYRIFSGILTRCNNPNTKSYRYYGSRGIKCLFQSFDEFKNYIVDVLQVDPRGLQIDRIDNNGNYELGNIRFVTAKINCQNRKR